MSELHPVSTRERILDAARRVFDRLGYEATRVEDILHEASVSRPTFYRVFRNKDEVFAETSGGDAPPQRSARERVLEGSREAFGQLGYELTRVEDILAAAGVSRPTFYRIFSSKQECYEELDRIAVAYLRRAIEAVGSRQGEFADLLELTIASYFEWRIGLKLPFSASAPVSEPPGVTHLRSELLKTEHVAGGPSPMLTAALISAIDVLASSWRDDDVESGVLVGARRQLAVELVLKALPG